MKDTPNEKDLKTSPQLTEIFLKSEYVFHIDSTNNTNKSPYWNKSITRKIITICVT